MYSSEKNPGINWKDLVIKAIFLVVFLLLLVWLFPKVPNMKPFYSNVFRENIKYMQDAAESYYTTDKLPKNIGDTAEMTLQEMINKNLILPFVDENGESCDTNSSYVQVIKNKNDYTLKVNLVCPNEKNYVKKTLGCYQYCEDCEEQLEYQFKKPSTQTQTSYSCPDGGTLSNGVCNIYTTDKYKATATTTTGEAYCPDGGTLKNGRCYVTIERSYKASVSSGDYYCPNGGRLSGKYCYVDTTSSYKPSTTYSCPNGGTLSGTYCLINASNSNYAASIKNYTCPDGTVQNSSTCKTGTEGSSYAAKATTKTETLKTTNTKGSGYTLISAGYEYTCSNHALCPKRVYYYTYSYKKTTYSCPNGGTLNGTTCVIAGTSSTTTGRANYDCPNGGTLSGTTCLVAGKASSYLGTANKTCPNGGRLSGSLCYINSSYNYLASRDYDYEYCPDGGYLSNGRCYYDDSYDYKASNKAGQTVYTCPNGGTLDGKNCVISKLSKSYPAKVNYSQVSVNEYKWSTSKTLEGWTATGETRTLAAKN